MSEFRIGATIRGSDGDLGTLDALVIDPTTQCVTALVITHETLAPRLLVPESLVQSADPDVIAVDLDEAGVHQCEAFDEPNFNAPDDEFAYGDLVMDPGSYFLEPFASPLDGWALTTHERVAKGEITIRRGASVHTSDGTKVGHVDEFLIDPDDGHITHVVVREGTLRHKDVVVPIRSATQIDDEDVVLDIDLPTLHALPAVPVRRHHHLTADET